MKEVLQQYGWTYKGECSYCNRAQKWQKREYEVKVFKNNVFKLFYRGTKTFTGTGQQLEEKIKDI